MKPDYVRIGLRIRRLRRRLGMTQEDIAELTGLSATYISMLERGKKCLSLDSAVAIADALRCDLGYLLTGSSTVSFPGTYTPEELALLQKLLSELFELLSSYKVDPSAEGYEASDCKG